MEFISQFKMSRAWTMCFAALKCTNRMMKIAKFSIFQNLLQNILKFSHFKNGIIFMIWLQSKINQSINSTIGQRTRRRPYCCVYGQCILLSTARWATIYVKLAQKYYVPRISAFAEGMQYLFLVIIMQTISRCSALRYRNSNNLWPMVVTFIALLLLRLLPALFNYLIIFWFYE